MKVGPLYPGKPVKFIPDVGGIFYRILPGQNFSIAVGSVKRTLL